MEHGVEEKLKSLKKGDKLTILPFTRNDGDFYNSVAFPCPGIAPEIPIELKEPVQAIFHGFYEDMISVSTDWIECLILDIRFIKDITVIP